ncbi:MAG: phosphate ABC transporter ATP-binding protein PstB, partial [bacterium]
MVEAAHVISPPNARVLAEDLSFYYGDFQALKHINMSVIANNITALIGPSGCGKSTFLRCINRMNDLIPDTRMEGNLFLDNAEINSPNIDVVALRRKVGMVFQRPNPFPKSIYENVAFGPRIHGVKNREQLDEIVRQALSQAFLWEEVKDKLWQSALALSGGQQQRLCIARVLAVEPDVILMDEPTASLDPTATYRIEELLDTLKASYTIVIVTHSLSQAARISDYTAFFMIGEVMEYEETAKLFQTPTHPQTENYIRG